MSNNAFMMPGGGLTNGKLALADADASDVMSGKTFYAGDKEIKTGTFDLSAADAGPNDVMSGKKFYASDKTLKTGTFIQHDIAYHWYETKAVNGADYFGSCGCFVIPGKSATKVNWGGSASGNFIIYTNKGQKFTIEALKNCKVTVQSVYNKGSVSTQTLTMTTGQSKTINVANDWTNEYGWGIIDAYA